MDQREHPRIQLPFEVELKHPTLGAVPTIARDASEGGLFVLATETGLRPGAQVKVTARGTPLVDSTPTPTVDMKVTRVAEDGLGLAFINHTGRHLWRSVKRLRDELRVGRDYFQVFQSAIVINDEQRLLIVKQNGRWLFPGDYLVVGEDWRELVSRTLIAELGLANVEHLGVLGVDSAPDTRAVEGAVFAVFHVMSMNGRRYRLAAKGRYDQARWIAREQEIEQLTFSDEKLRVLAREALKFQREEQPVR